MCNVESTFEANENPITLPIDNVNPNATAVRMFINLVFLLFRFISDIFFTKIVHLVVNLNVIYFVFKPLFFALTTNRCFKTIQSNTFVEKNMKNSKIKRLFLTDILLIPTFIGIVVTGLGLHVAVHHHYVSNTIWKPLHLAFACLSVILVIMHIYQHLGWYKGLLNRTAAKRSQITAILSILFIITTLSGFLIYINSYWGALHYKLGIILVIISLVHIGKRLGWLIKNISATKSMH